MDFQLLQKLCSIPAPSGDEGKLTAFLLEYIHLNSANWKVKPRVLHGDGWQNNIVLVFGKPRTALFAHIDSIGFTVRYENQLVPIGSPDAKNGYRLVGEDQLGPIECRIRITNEDELRHDFGRSIQRGTSLTWKPDFRNENEWITSGYLDNRLGVYSALKVAETLTDGIIVFSTWEEHGGGAVPYLIKYCVEEHNITQALVADITWITDGIQPGEGVVISLRDKLIPRKIYTDRIIALAEQSNIPFQLEVEGAGSSDGREIQFSPYAVDWCFIGAGEANVHSPQEVVHKEDIKAMKNLLNFLMKEL